MTAVVYQMRDFQSKKDIERMQRELEKEAAKILAETTGSYDFAGPFNLEKYEQYLGINKSAGIGGVKLDKDPA